MAMTLQDVFDAVKAIPKRFGFARWFSGKQPICPMAQLVLADLSDEQFNRGGLDLSRRAAERLNVPSRDIADFISWWDKQPDKGRDTTRERTRLRRDLVKRGYKVPTRKELRRAGLQ